MVYYIVLFAYMVLVQYLYRNSKGNEVVKMLITFLPLFLFGALRVSCGDYEIYESYNNWVRSTSGNINDVIERMEPGYALLNKLLPYRWIIIVSSFLACFAYSMLLLKLVPRQYRWFGIVILFIVSDKTFYFMFSGIRNSIAISLLILFVVYRINNSGKGLITIRELMLFVVLTSIAYSIHASAIMFFPLTFLMILKRKVNTIEIFIWIALLIVLWIVPVEQMGRIDFFSENDYFERYSGYIEEGRDAGMLAKFGATCFALLCLADIRMRGAERNCFISRLALLFVYSYLLGSLNGRVSQYYISFMIVYLADVFKDRKSNILQMALLLFAVVFLAYSSFVAGVFGNVSYSPFINYRISLSVF